MSTGGWKKLSSKIVYKTPWMKVVEDQVIRPDGKRGMYSYVQTNGDCVMIVPITENNEVYLIKQYRYTKEEDSWEVPGGNSEGEDLLLAAKRELQEESGLVADDWKLIGHSQSMNGITDEKTHVFIARKIRETSSNKMGEEGIHEMKKVPFSEVLEMVKQSKITDGQSVVAIAKAALFLNETSVNPSVST